MGRAPLLGLLALSASTRAVASDEPPCAGGFCSRRAWSCSWGACTPAELARRRTPPRPSEFWGACAGLPARPRLLPPEAAADGCELVLSIPLPVHAVFDFSCPETWSESTYESTLYCVMPQTGLMTLVETAAAGSNTANSSNPSIALVVPAAQAHATEQLLDAASLRSALLLVLPPGRDCSASCVRLPHKDVRVAWFDIPEGYGELDPAGARAYRARALRAAGLPPPGQGGRPDVLALISRPAGGSRAFANEDELAAELARAAPGLQLRRYFGNESVRCKRV